MILLLPHSGNYRGHTASYLSHQMLEGLDHGAFFFSNCFFFDQQNLWMKYLFHGPQVKRDGTVLKFWALRTFFICCVNLQFPLENLTMFSVWSFGCKLLNEKKKVQLGFKAAIILNECSPDEPFAAIITVNKSLRFSSCILLLRFQILQGFQERIRIAFLNDPGSGSVAWSGLPAEASLVPVIWVMVVARLQPLASCGLLLYLASLINCSAFSLSLLLAWCWII